MHLTRRDFLRSAAIAAGTGISPNIKAYANLLGIGSCATDGNCPNIIMIVVDTLRADHLSLMGYCRNTSPNLDEFSRRAVVFENAISPSPWTFPSFVSLMTGMLACNHNQNLAPPNARPLSCTFLPELLSQAGYSTSMILVNCLVEDFAYGFNENYHLCGSRNSDDEQAIDTAIDWLSRDDKTQNKFFMLIWLMGPHRPYEPANGFLQEFVQDDLYMNSQLRNIEILGHLISPQELPSEVLEILGSPLMSDGLYHDYRLYVAAYDSEIKHADYQLGRLFTTLRERGLYDDAMILFTSDHGENMVDHEICFWHGDNLYNSLIHVPLLIKLPQQRGSNVVKKQVRTIDALPTAFHVLNIDPGDIDGQSLIPFVSSKPVCLYQRPCISYWKSSSVTDVVSIVRGRFKLIKSSNGQEELYDYIDDHDETTNIISSHPDIYETLNEYLMTFYEPGKFY